MREWLIPIACPNVPTLDPNAFPESIPSDKRSTRVNTTALYRLIQGESDPVSGGPEIDPPPHFAAEHRAGGSPHIIWENSIKMNIDDGQYLQEGRIVCDIIDETYLNTIEMIGDVHESDGQARHAFFHSLIGSDP